MTKLDRRTALTIAISLLGLAAMPSTAQVTWPTGKPITWVVPYPRVAPPTFWAAPLHCGWATRSAPR